LYTGVAKHTRHVTVCGKQGIKTLDDIEAYLINSPKKTRN
jgi:hypothetical protein